MKGICQIWSRGRLVSPSLPVGGDWYLKFSSQSDHRAEISGNIVWYNALAPRPEVLTVALAFCLHMRSFPKSSSLQVLTIFQSKNICLVSTEYQTLIL